MDKTSLSDRMKSYESLYNLKIMNRLPVIIRLDGKNFSSLTKKHKFTKPFSNIFANMIINTMINVARNIQGCLVGYTQSDEITLVLRNDQSLESTPWFGNRIQKMCSILASLAAASFNSLLISQGFIEGFNLEKNKLVCFDSRVFAVPSITEALNNLIWRQNDCVKNSISSVTYYEIAKLDDYEKGKTRKMMFGLNQKQQQDLSFKTAGINWNNYEAKYKRGTVTFKENFKSKVIPKFKNGIPEDKRCPDCLNINPDILCFTCGGTDIKPIEVVRTRWKTEPAPIFTSEEGKSWLSNVISLEKKKWRRIKK